MDWYLLYKTFSPIVLGAAVIYISFKLPASYVKSERRGKKTAANGWEVLWAFIRVMFCCLFVGCIFSYSSTEKMRLINFTVWASVSLIPATIGLLSFFEKDSKMNITDRIVQQIQMDNEEREASAMHDDRF